MMYLDKPKSTEQLQNACLRLAFAQAPDDGLPPDLAQLLALMREQDRKLASAGQKAAEN